jgi:ATP-dependent helicase HepA
MFIVGQRWFSEAEPELGLGTIESVLDKQVKVTFKASDEVRTYGSKTAPLKRLKYAVNDQILTDEGLKFTVSEIIENEGLVVYQCGEVEVEERQLKADLNFSKPQDKLFAGSFDEPALFDLRYESFLKKRAYQQFKHKGLLGSRVRLIPHQVFLSGSISERINPKVMLADEVGLGKTIEAGLVLNSLIEKHKVHRALIIVPDSLVYQWFFELQNKFNITAKTMSLTDELGIEAEDIEEGSHYVVSLGRLIQDDNLREKVLNTKDWDILIMDEAHALKWTKEKSSPEFDLAKNLSKIIPSIILLSATPEILGVEGHFSRLNLLDESKFSDLDKYLKESKNYREHLPLISKIIANEHSDSDLSSYFSSEEISNFNNHGEIIRALIDRHGTGRVYFRNTREYLEKFDLFFPKRKLSAYPIEIEGQINDKIVFSKKLIILKNILDENPEEKVLLLVQSKVIALKIQRQLEAMTSVSVGLFHSGQSLMERDRQAAYFADQDGARILLCTEIGSEGRNFEFAHHLYLFDLPKLPEQLEQRIGRLDRIGQKKDINIHVPFVKGSFEEVLFRWYNEVIGSFNAAPKGATSFYASHRDELQKLLVENFDDKKLSNFITEMTKQYEVLCQELSQGHDALLDLNSFNKEESYKIIETIHSFNEKHNLQDYLDMATEACGLHLEELSRDVYFIRPNDNMLIPSYPALDSEGFSFTKDRDLALVRDDLKYLTWEHPLVRGTIDLFSQSEIGNMSAVTHNGALGADVFFEFIFKLECVGSESSEITRFLPITPVRVLLNSKSIDMTAKIPKSKLDQLVDASVSSESKVQISKIPKAAFNEFLKKAAMLANDRSKKYKTMGQEALGIFCKGEIGRLESLKKSNSLIKDSDIKPWKDFYESSKSNIENATISIDSIRVIL